MTITQCYDLDVLGGGKKKGFNLLPAVFHLKFEVRGGINNVDQKVIENGYPDKEVFFVLYFYFIFPLRLVIVFIKKYVYVFFVASELCVCFVVFFCI